MDAGGAVTMAATHADERPWAAAGIACRVPACMARRSTSAAHDLGCDSKQSKGEAEDATPVPRGPRSTLAIASVLAAMVLVVLDAAIANVALPTIAASLHVTPAMSVWVITAYQAALLMALLPCAALGESLGYRRVFMAGIALFTGASVLCALSPSLPWLVAARFLQGLGGAGVMALGVALLRVVVPHQRLGAAIGWNALAIALSSAAGPTLGAVILSGSSWPWLFAVNLPLGMLVLLATRALPKTSGTARRLDKFSVVLNAGAFAALIMGAELLPASPAPAAVLIAAAAFAIVALVRRELPKEAPLIPLDLLRAASFRISVIASILCFSGVTAGMIALPFYLQHGLGAVALWPLKGNLLPLIPLTMLCGLGFSLFNVANNRSMFLSAPKERSGAAGGLQGSARLLGQTSGAVVMTLLFTLALADAAPRIGLGIGAGSARG